MTTQPLSEKDFVCDKSFTYDNEKKIVILADDVKQAIQKTLKELKEITECKDNKGFVTSEFLEELNIEIDTTFKQNFGNKLITRITPVDICINCKEKMAGCTWTDESRRYHKLIEQIMEKHPLCETCAFRFSKTKYFLDKIAVKKSVKHKSGEIKETPSFQVEVMKGG